MTVAYCFGRKFPKSPSSILTSIADDVRICFTVVIQNPPMEQVTMQGGILSTHYSRASSFVSHIVCISKSLKLALITEYNSVKDKIISALGCDTVKETELPSRTGKGVKYHRIQPNNQF